MLQANQIEELEQAIHEIVANPSPGSAKKGDGVDVYKFKMVDQLTLLACQHNKEQLILVALGSHENFYRNLKK